MKRRQWIVGMCVAAASAMTGVAQAQTQEAASALGPGQPLKLQVGFPPGSGPDVIARAVAHQLGEVTGRSVVVDNRAGAGGQIAAQGVARSAPDGTTLLLGEVGSISIAPAAYANLAYDPPRDFSPVAEVVRSDFVLVVPADATARTVDEFVTNARASKDRINFGTFGAGTPGHFGAELFGQQANFPVEPIHYRTTGDAVSAIISGDVQAAFVSTALAMAQVQGGKMRALATTAAERSALLPEVPTFTEAGMPDIDISAWFTVFVPQATPEPMQEALSQALVTAMQSPKVKRTLEEAGFTITGLPRAEVQAIVANEDKRWEEIVKASGFKPD